jgi:hypothetical protein
LSEILAPQQSRIEHAGHQRDQHVSTHQ